MLRKELQEKGVLGPIVRIANPWYYRTKNTETWTKIGESDAEHQNFPTRRDTTSLKNGQYEVMGLMHVFAKKDGNEIAIARQNVVELTVKN